MNPLAWLAFAAATGAVILGVLEANGKAPQWTRHRARLTWLAAGASLAMFLYLVWLFVVADVTKEYVFLYTRTDLPLRYRLAGAWAGREGSLALWGLWAIIVAAIYDHRSRDADRRLTSVFLTGLAAAFLGAVAWSDLFAATPEFFLQQRPGGNGLNPTLQSDFFIIHPPMMFIAYALTNIPVAAALSHFVTGHGQWSTHTTNGARVNWLLYTAAMGLGGIWAYYTLGFGGYWAWDPVEVANLLPWLGLTLYLHVQLHHRRHGRYAMVGPILAFLPWLLTLFSTISTRSGLWVSVHAFTDPTQTYNPDAPARFLDILAVEPSLKFYLALILATVGFGLALWHRRLATDAKVLPRASRLVGGALAAFGMYGLIAPVSAFSALAQVGSLLADAGLGMLMLAAAAVLIAGAPMLTGADERNRLDLRGLAYASILILGTSLMVLVLWHFAAANGWSTAFYEERLPVLAAPAMAALMVFMLLPYGRKQALAGAGALVAVGTVAAVATDLGTGFTVAAALLVVASLDRTRRALGPKAGRVEVGRVALLLGALLNVLFWLNPPSRVLGISLHWPIQLVAIVMVAGLHMTIRYLAGDERASRWAHGITFLGGAFFVAPILAGISWATREAGTFKPARVRQAALYGAHLAIAVALLGYGTTTYFGEESQETLIVGEPAEVAGMNVTAFAGTTQGDDRIDSFHPGIDTPYGRLAGTLYWEPQTGSYYPLPATHRAWDRDVYLAVDSICVREPCEGPFEVIQAYAPTVQAPPMEIYEVTVTVFVLPGLGLVWMALGLFVYSMGVIAQSGIHLSRLSSRKTP